MDTTDETVALSDESTTEEVAQDYGGLSGYIKAKFVRAEDGIRDFCLSRGLGDVYKRQVLCHFFSSGLIR